MYMVPQHSTQKKILVFVGDSVKDRNVGIHKLQGLLPKDAFRRSVQINRTCGCYFVTFSPIIIVHFCSSCVLFVSIS